MIVKNAKQRKTKQSSIRLVHTKGRGTSHTNNNQPQHKLNLEIFNLNFKSKLSQISKKIVPVTPYLLAKALLDHSRVLLVRLARSWWNLLQNKVLPVEVIALNLPLGQLQDLLEVLAN